MKPRVKAMSSNEIASSKDQRFPIAANKVADADMPPDWREDYGKAYPIPSYVREIA